MISPLFYAIGFAALMGGLLVEVRIFRAMHDDPPSIYKLFALRDKLIRLVVDKEIARREPHFDAIYKNVNIILGGCRRLSGPSGWTIAEEDGKHLAHYPHDHVKLLGLPTSAPPAQLAPISFELRDALEHIIDHHFGLYLLMDERRREQTRIQKAHARELLKMLHGPTSCAA
jgi:hypothetical protein